MSGLRRTYLVLAAIGAVWPMWHIVRYLTGEGGTLPGMVALWLANDATRGLTADLIVTGTALTIWIVAETLVRKNWTALIAIPATFLVGVSFGLPLYLFLRTRAVT
ncbi:DUF2834 domain-containing protein [Sinisalibacter aestuarii]|uniref:DUF2834 domain-containing protein n=1 Tax=Sinisalibacter aestuarii TaxID=2949426 RepID=A0ABQ5LMP0_9RHOB|nr:DUF2834 domain-containing protein [Sinisalibacter aestuarii]GKY86220.1 hypothetical protein STA1M1_00890 [Sinisalibacter aestuarii]